MLYIVLHDAGPHFVEKQIVLHKQCALDHPFTALASYNLSTHICGGKFMWNKQDPLNSLCHWI